MAELSLGRNKGRVVDEAGRVSLDGEDGPTRETGAHDEWKSGLGDVSRFIARQTTYVDQRGQRTHMIDKSKGSQRREEVEKKDEKRTSIRRFSQVGCVKETIGIHTATSVLEKPRSIRSELRDSQRVCLV